MDWGRLPEKIATGFLGLSLLFAMPTAQAETVSENPTKENSKVEVPAKPTAPVKKIVINSASRILTLYEGDKKISMYSVGLGKTSTPTPVGYYKILEKAINPSWIDPSDPEYEIPSGPSNPLGYRWMQIQGNYGIHGTNRPDSIGYYVSNGCIRMLEKDVEELFENVEVNTPVEITYNRIVVEKADDDNVVYYIYPDGYGWQKIEVADVLRWIEPYGVAPFVTEEEIANKIKTSDGEPNYIGKPYNIELNGKKIQSVDINGRKFISRAVVRDSITYLPVVPIAVALNTKIEWRAAESTLKTAYGEVTGYDLKKQIYCNADDAVVLFNIDGGLKTTSNGGKIISLISIKPPTIEIPNPIENPTNKPNDKPIENPTDKPNDKPIENPTNKPNDKPIENSTDKPKDKPVENSTDKPKDNPIERPSPNKNPTVNEKPTTNGGGRYVNNPFEDVNTKSASRVKGGEV